MPRTSINGALFGLGAVLIAGGQYTLTDFDAVTLLLRGRIGGTLLCAMNDILPCGVGLGYLAVGLGALLVAIAISRPAPTSNVQGPTSKLHASQPVHGLAGDARARLWVTALIVTAVALAALGSALSIRTQPGTWPPLLWLATYLLPIPAMIALDHARGTSFRNPFRTRWEWAALLLIVAFDLILVGHGMTHWRWAGTPDETDFFGVAKSIVVGTSQRAVLSEGGVFNFQPVLSSYYQAAFMKVFGVNIFAWRLSSAVALAGSLPLLYLFTRELWNRRTAFMATLFFGSAQLAVGFSHFGYNNVQVYLVIGGGLGMVAWARTRQSLLGYYLAGCIAGLGFYTYYTARVVAPLLLLMIWSCDGFPLARKVRARTLALAFGLGLTILPVFSDFSQLLHNMQQLALTSDQTRTVAATASRVLEHWFLSIVHGLWYPGPHHFQSNPIEDPISSTLAVIGFWLCIGGWRHRANGRFLVLAYLLSALLVGATSPHFRPPLTRLLFLSPLTAILAAAGADQLLRVLDGDGRTRQNETRVVAGVLVIVSMVWNIATIEYNVRFQHHGYGVGTTSELLRMTQQLPREYRIIFVQATDAQDALVGAVMDEYGMNERFDYQRGVDTPTIALLGSVTPPFVVFTDIADPQQNAMLEVVMAQRFPAGVWRASDPGQPWNLRYFDMRGAGTGERLH